MMRTGHRLARGAGFVAAVLVAVWLLGNRPTQVSPPSPIVTISVAPPSPASSASELLFASPPIDAMPAGRTSGPPQLLGIVGRLSDPLVMVRAGDGPVVTIGRGQSAGGWSLMTVASDRATFRRGAEERVSVLPPRDSGP